MFIPFFLRLKEAKIPVTLREFLALLDGMEKQGFIERRVEASDRRAKQIHMTGRGRDIADEIDKLACEIRKEVLGGVDDTDKAIALQVVSQMAGNIVAISRD